MLRLSSVLVILLIAGCLGEPSSPESPLHVADPVAGEAVDQWFIDYADWWNLTPEMPGWGIGLTYPDSAPSFHYGPFISTTPARAHPVSHMANLTLVFANVAPGPTWVEVSVRSDGVEVASYDQFSLVTTTMASMVGPVAPTTWVIPMRLMGPVAEGAVITLDVWFHGPGTMLGQGERFPSRLTLQPPYWIDDRFH